VSEKLTLLQRLSAARDLTRLTGTLDELQSRNLEMWGRIAFSPAKFGLAWDGETRSVEYDVLAGPPPPARTAKEHEAYLSGLDTSLKDLLGPEWLLTVKEKGVVVFTGPRKEPYRPVKPQVPERGEMETDARRDPKE
jgi:hypothetical protein